MNKVFSVTCLRFAVVLCCILFHLFRRKLLVLFSRSLWSLESMRERERILNLYYLVWKQSTLLGATIFCIVIAMRFQTSCFNVCSKEIFRITSIVWPIYEVYFRSYCLLLLRTTSTTPITLCMERMTSSSLTTSSTRLYD